jgi:hypothetical protein
MEINRPDNLGDVSDLGLIQAHAKRLLAGIRPETLSVDAWDHAIRRPRVTTA